MRTYILLLIFLLPALTVIGCTATITPAPTATLVPASATLPPTATIPPTATLPPTVTPTNTPEDYTGLWDGSANDGSLSGSFQFIVTDNEVTEIVLNYTLRNGGCTIISILSGTADESFIDGNRVHATMFVSGGNIFTFNGTFETTKHAQGTLTYKGTHADCGAFEKSAPWSAENGPIPPTRTPTPVPPSETPTRFPTETGTPIPTDSKAVPTQEASVRY